MAGAFPPRVHLPVGHGNRCSAQTGSESDIVSLIHRLDELVENVNHLLIAVDHDLERGSKDFMTSVQKLKSILIYLNETSRMINEDPSILIRGTSLEDIPDDDLDR